MGLDKDDIMALIAILQKGLQDDEPQDKKKTQSTKTKKSKITNKTTRNKKFSGQEENKFLSMGVKDLHKEDTTIDKLLSKGPRAQRTRKFNVIEVKCRSCGKTEKINPVLLYDSVDRYKCNVCCTSPG